MIDFANVSRVLSWFLDDFLWCFWCCRVDLRRSYGGFDGFNMF